MILNKQKLGQATVLLSGVLLLRAALAKDREMRELASLGCTSTTITVDMINGFVSSSDCSGSCTDGTCVLAALVSFPGVFDTTYSCSCQAHDGTPTSSIHVPCHQEVTVTAPPGIGTPVDHQCITLNCTGACEESQEGSNLTKLTFHCICP